MELVWVVLLMVLEVGVILAMGLLMYRSEFRIPQVLFSSIISVISQLLLAVKAWILFDVFFWQYVVGAAAIAACSVVIGLALQVFSNSMSPEKNRRANALSGLTSQLKQSRLQGIAVFILGVATAAVLWFAFDQVRRGGAGSPEAITAGMIIYFTIGAFVGVLYSALLTVLISGDRTVDPAVRNILAISSLGGWAGQAWRAAFPLLFLPEPHAAFGFELNLQVVLTLLGGLYFVAVVLPVVFGARLYREEKERFEIASSAIIERTVVLSSIDVEPSILESKRIALASDISDVIINLNARDMLLRRYTFWRWAPNPAFQSDGSNWMLKPNWQELEKELEESNKESGLTQLLHVIERPWFQWLVGEQKRFRRNPFQEQMLGLFLPQIPNWSYRARLVDDLVVILEKVAQGDLRNAAGLSQLSRAELTTVFAPERGRTVLAAAVMSLLTLLNSAGLTIFGEDIRRATTELISDPTVFGAEDAAP